MVGNTWPGLVIGELFLVFGMYLVWSAYKTHQIIVASRTWPVITGRVIKARINTLVTFGNFNLKGYYCGYGFYQSKITYCYSVEGDEYISKVRLKTRLSNTATHDRLLPIGRIMKVSYNPEKPQDCISEYDEEGFPWFGVCTIALGVGVVLVALSL
jgi:hypothetical protein